MEKRKNLMKTNNIVGKHIKPQLPSSPNIKIKMILVKTLNKFLKKF